MAFLRRAGDFTPQENMVYSYWIIMLQLLQIGIAWEAILEFSENEIMLILGIQGAFDQLKAEAEAKSMARSRANF